MNDNCASKRARHRPSATEIRFYDSREDDANPVKVVDVGDSTELVLWAVWAGDDIEISLSSTAQECQRTGMYYAFFENYTYANSFSKKIDLDGLDQAQWLFQMDVVLIGEDQIEERIKELVIGHKNEILRIRKENMKQSKTG